MSGWHDIADMLNILKKWATGEEPANVTVKTIEDKVEIENTPTSLGVGRKTITAAGTAERLTESTLEDENKCQYVIVTALSSNTGRAVIGGQGVLAATGSVNGITLYVINGVPESKIIPIDDPYNIFCDVETSGQGVSFVPIY